MKTTNFAYLQAPSSRYERSSSNYNIKQLVARTKNMCNSAAGTHIFCGSATGLLELALGTVPTRGGGV
jgi:hypothetical protein